jgi:hypothetical protein
MRGVDFPLKTTNLAFANWILDLRENKREWSNELARLIVVGSTLDSEPETALLHHKSQLAKFIELCPWLSFVELANGEKERIEKN